MNQECVDVIEALCDAAAGTFRVYKLPGDASEWPALRGFEAAVCKAGWACFQYDYGVPFQSTTKCTAVEECVCLFAKAIGQEVVAGAWFPRDDPEDYKVASVPQRNSTMLTCTKSGRVLGCLIAAGFITKSGPDPWLPGQDYLYYCERLLSAPFKRLQDDVFAGEFADPCSAAMEILKGDFGYRHIPIPQPL